MNSAFSQNLNSIPLPAPNKKSGIPVSEAIENRKSIRHYSNEPLSLNEISQLLWSAGGVTCDGLTGPSRSYPSAGACHPLEIYIIVGNVTGLENGFYHYNWDTNTLQLKSRGDKRRTLSQAAWSQPMIVRAPISIIFTGIFPRTTKKYGDRGERYIYMDTGHAGQNIYLQATSMGLGTVAIGAFQDDKVSQVLNLPKEEKPLYIMPVGKLEQQ